MRHLSWIFTLPVTVIVVLFAVTNRAPATLSFWPLPWAIQLPTYLIILGALFVGFMLGAAVAWLSGSRRRRQARRLAEQVRAQNRQLVELQRRQAAEAAAPPPPPQSMPATVPTTADGERRIARASSL